MGVFEDFNKLHISIRSIFLSTISIFPFYFISVVLFKKDLISNFNDSFFYLNDFNVVFIFSLCFALSLIWVISNVFLSVGISYFIEKMMNEIHDQEMPFILTYFYSLAYLSICILVNYLVTKVSFVDFVMLSHFFLFVRFLWTYGWYLKWKSDNK